MSPVRVRLFGPAREAAGRAADVIDGATVDDVLVAATSRYGAAFAELLATCRIWVNGDQAGGDCPLRDGDEVAVLPPVSGG
jgi:MoaD family protein